MKVKREHSIKNLPIQFARFVFYDDNTKSSVMQPIGIDHFRQNANRMRFLLIDSKRKIG